MLACITLVPNTAQGCKLPSFVLNTEGLPFIVVIAAKLNFSRVPLKMIIMWREWSIQCLWSLIRRQSTRSFPHITLDAVLKGPRPALLSMANCKTSGFPLYLEQSMSFTSMDMSTQATFLWRVWVVWVHCWFGALRLACSALWPSQVTNGPSYSGCDLHRPLTLWPAAARSALDEPSSPRPP